MREFVKFELVVWFEPELDGSIMELKKQIASAIFRGTDAKDVELATIESGVEKDGKVR